MMHRNTFIRQPTATLALSGVYGVSVSIFAASTKTTTIKG
jgi:hypothetical protein